MRMANRRGSAASEEASLLADTRCRLNPLVVRRFAPNSQWMLSAAIVAGREASGNNVTGEVLVWSASETPVALHPIVGRIDVS